MKSWQGMLMAAAWSAVEIGQDSAVTVGHRLPMLAAMPFFPGPDLVLEANRMVTEKLAAVLEGSFAATSEAMALTTRAVLGHSNPLDLATGMLSIAITAARPTRRRVRANAKRLSHQAS